MKSLCVAAGVVLFTAGCATSRQTESVAAQEEVPMTSPATPDGYRRVTGPFDAKMTPQPPYDTTDGINLGRATVDKRFHGALDATGAGRCSAP